MTRTTWLPTLSPEGPRYRALADEIARAVEEGQLRAGVKLPPVRDLAWDLKVTPGTVARAYQLAEQRGLLEGQVGRGTYVKGAEPEGPLASPVSLAAPADGVIDFRLNRAVDIGQDVIITAALERVIARHGALPLTDYHRFGEDISEREAGAEWLRSGGVPADPAHMVVCSGAQHGMLTALAATCGGGDAVVLTEALIHPGLKDCARALGMRLEPVACDADGLEPDALDAACARYRPGAIILSANCQNPMLTTMPLKRREAIAEVVRRRRVSLIEDDVYGWLKPQRLPSFPSLAPELTWYVASLSKCVAAGIRAGYVLCPPGETPRAARILQSYTQHVSWLISALAAEIVRSGDAERIIRQVSDETAARAQILRDALAGGSDGALLQTDDHTSMAWLGLPEPWRASDFAVGAEAANVLVSPAEIFAVGRAPAPHAIRIGFGNAPERAEVSTGAAVLARLLSSDPLPVDAVA
ncbi:MAG: PLP-dependent aminotransferase family protein [Pseudomonadota bacterium]